MFAACATAPESHVVAIETSRSAVADARENLSGRSYDLVRGEVGGWRAPAGLDVDVVIADPARSGLGAPGTAALTRLDAPVLVLVSCDPGSLGRDAKLLGRDGYVHERSELIDTFPADDSRRGRFTVHEESEVSTMLSPVISDEVRRRYANAPPLSPSSRRSSPTSVCRHRATPRRSSAVWRRSVAPGQSRLSRPCSTASHASALPPTSTSAFSGSARKAAERDLAVAVAQRWDFGATTVSASVALAAAAGVAVFATGGIGGVHRDAEETGDVSADLDALANYPVITVSAGAKAFLDLRRTLEYLETRGVPVVGWQHNWFPAFYTRSSGLPVPHRVDDAATVAAVFAARPRDTGILVAVPIPDEAELDPMAIDVALSTALDSAAASGTSGAAVTPFVLGAIAAATEGGSVPANLALAERNAGVAAEIAVAVSRLDPGGR